MLKVMLFGKQKELRKKPICIQRSTNQPTTYSILRLFHEFLKDGWKKMIEKNGNS